jgi:hypothetical protein
LLDLSLFAQISASDTTKHHRITNVTRAMDDDEVMSGGPRPSAM